jgi:hypothetical protein
MSPRFDLKRLLANRANTHYLLTPLVDRFLLTTELNDFTDEELDLARSLMAKWREGRSIEHHSPSSAGACLRQQMFTFWGFKGEQVDDPFLKAIFDDGNWRHLRWHLIFKRMERQGLLKVVAIEKRILYRPWLLGGTPDDVLDIPIPNGNIRVVVDIKGANNDKFKWVQNSNAPIDGHEWQLHAYMMALRLGRGIIWYENKNTQEYHEVSVLRDRKLIAELARRSLILRKARKTGILPDHDDRCSMRTGTPDPKDLIFRRCRQRFNCLKYTKEGY